MFNGRSATLAIFVCFSAIVATHVQADCVGQSAMRSFAGGAPDERSHLWTASVFSPLYFDTYAPFAYNRPYTADLSASFWAAGSPGNDNGAFDLVAAGGLVVAENVAYPVYYGAVLDTDWTDDAVVGCNGPDACTCLLLSDQAPSGRSGFFAVVAARSDSLGDTSFNLAGTDPVGNGTPIVLQPIPLPVVTATDVPVPGTVDVTVDIQDRLTGVYEAVSGSGCSCGPIGYSVLVQLATPSVDWVPPDDRDPGVWMLPPLAGGGAQGITAPDQSVTISVVCPSPATQRIYLATRLHFDGGFSTAFVSGNSVPIACDATLPLDPVSQRHPAVGRGRAGKCDPASETECLRP